MKKILLAIAVLASFQIADAQVKTPAAAKSAVESAKAASENPKKNTKCETWLKLGKAYIDAYAAPAGNGWKGASKQELALISGSSKPVSTSEVEIEGQAYTKECYETCNYYFNANGVLSIIEITKPVCDNALDLAVEALNKAYELDVKGSKKEDISLAVKDAVAKMEEEAFNAYTFGDTKKAVDMFKSAAKASTTPASLTIDTIAFYNTGFLAMSSGDNATAKEYFTQCIDKYGYIGNEGDVYARLATICESEGNKDGQKQYLEDGFAKCPQSQYILIGLINYYISNQQDTDRLFELVGQAKKNEPENASLWYVEGNIYKELGDTDKAVESYRKCADINPAYEYGFVGEGILYYNMALDIQDKAQAELDDAKYMALVADFEKALKSCIEPFTKAFETSKDDQLKVNVAEYLKNACYRFREEDATYNTLYEKYNAIVAAGTAQ